MQKMKVLILLFFKMDLMLAFLKHAVSEKYLITDYPCRGNRDDILNLGSHQSKPTNALLCKISCLDEWFIAVNCSELKFKKSKLVVYIFAKKKCSNSFTFVE